MFDSKTEFETLPEGLDEMPPGPELASVLAGVDVFRLSEFDRVSVLQAQARQLAHDYAGFYQAMVAVDQGVRQSVKEEGWAGDPYAYSSDEIRAALSWTRRRADHEMGLAWSLVQRLPSVWKALWEGRIDQPRARVISEETIHLSEAQASELAEQILGEAEDLTTGQIGHRLRRRITESDPELARNRYQQGLEERALIAQTDDDGTANLCGHKMNVIRTLGVYNKIDRLAQKLKTADDPRSIDQIRADVFLELLEGKHHNSEDDLPESSPKPVVDLRVDIETLMGLNEKAGEIPGWGPVISDIARQVAARQEDGEWRVTVTDPDKGAVLWNGITRRRPTIAQKRYIQSRIPTCVFPGCRMPARNSDLNHLTPYSQGGQTVVSELVPLCRHDHNLVHKGGWQVRRLDLNSYQWISPCRHVYTVKVEPP